MAEVISTGAVKARRAAEQAQRDAYTQSLSAAAIKGNFALSQPLFKTAARNSYQQHLNNLKFGADQNANQRRPSSAPNTRKAIASLHEIRTARPATANRAMRHFGRVSLYDRDTPQLAPHQVMGPTILRTLAPKQHGLSLRGPDKFLRQGQGLSLELRNHMKDYLQANPVNKDPPFKRGNAGIKLSFGSSAPVRANTLFRTYYDNGTLDFISVRWRGKHQDGLVWGRNNMRGGAMGSDGPPSATYRTWSTEPLEVNPAVWLPLFIEGVLEREEPYHFMAVRGSEELLFQAADSGRLAGMAESLVLPLRKLLETRQPALVAVALQLMSSALALAPACAESWICHLRLFAQIFNLFLGAGKLVVDLGYNARSARELRDLVTDVLHRLEVSGGPGATAAVRRYCRGHDPVVSNEVQDRAAARATRKAQEIAYSTAVPVEQLAAFKPFTLM